MTIIRMKIISPRRMKVTMKLISNSFTGGRRSAEMGGGGNEFMGSGFMVKYIG